MYKNGKWCKDEWCQVGPYKPVDLTAVLFSYDVHDARIGRNYSFKMFSDWLCLSCDGYIVSLLTVGINQMQFVDGKYVYKSIDMEDMKKVYEKIKVGKFTPFSITETRPGSTGRRMIKFFDKYVFNNIQNQQDFTEYLNKRAQMQCQLMQQTQYPIYVQIKSSKQR